MPSHMRFWLQIVLLAPHPLPPHPVLPLPIFAFLRCFPDTEISIFSSRSLRSETHSYWYSARCAVMLWGASHPLAVSSCARPHPHPEPPLPPPPLQARTEHRRSRTPDLDFLPWSPTRVQCHPGWPVRLERAGGPFPAPGDRGYPHPLCDFGEPTPRSESLAIPEEQVGERQHGEGHKRQQSGGPLEAQTLIQLDPKEREGG